MRLRPRSVMGVTAGLLVVVLAIAAVHLLQVHSRSYEYRWSPSATAPKVQFAGRDYLRGQQMSRLPSDTLLLGRTEGGGRIYGHQSHADVPTVVYARDGGRVFDYALSGGP